MILYHFNTFKTFKIFKTFKRSLSIKSKTNTQVSIYNISDLHLENYNNVNNLYKNLEKIMPKANILTLSGDIGYPLNEYGKMYSELLKKFKEKYDHVILVPGNHEYFQIKNFNRDSALNRLREICHSESCHLLNNESIEILGIKFLGTTLWSKIDPKYQSMLDVSNRKGKMFKTIFPTINAANEEFAKNHKWLKTSLNKTKSKHQVIITHHVPSYSLQHESYKNIGSEFVNSLFYSEILNGLDLSKVRYWFCGHTHESGKLKHGNTDIIINPYGVNVEKRKTKISSQIYLI